jgi:plasmid stabilization system protein ParE
MKWPIRLVPEAKAEFDADADWYEEKQIGLGVDFVAKVRDVLNRIAKNPRIHATIHGDVRKAVVQRFPYIVLCVEEPDEVVVIAVFHTSRDPAIWKKRLNGEPRV